MVGEVRRIAGVLPVIAKRLTSRVVMRIIPLADSADPLRCSVRWRSASLPSAPPGRVLVALLVEHVDDGAMSSCSCLGASRTESNARCMEVVSYHEGKARLTIVSRLARYRSTGFSGIIGAQRSTGVPPSGWFA